MPKRMCPFDYDLIPQHKIHISDKEICHEDIKKSVYEKTLKKLFCGAKRIPAEDCNSSESKGASNVPKQSYKQMLLNNFCRLQPGGEIKPEPKVWCETCSGLQKEMQTRCTFCEKFLCVECTMKCNKCQDDFCKTCSLVMYGSLEDECVCVSCCR